MRIWENNDNKQERTIQVGDFVVCYAYETLSGIYHVDEVDDVWAYANFKREEFLRKTRITVSGRHYVTLRRGFFNGVNYYVATDEEADVYKRRHAAESVYGAVLVGGASDYRRYSIMPMQEKTGKLQDVLGEVR